MAWHDSGTVSVTNGSSTVAGVGTDWLAGLRPGDALFLPDGWPYEVLNIASDTMLQLTRPYAGPTKSGERYTQLPSQGYIKLSADQLAALARQIGGIPTRVESLEGSQLSKDHNLSDLEDMEAARQNLGLKALAVMGVEELGSAAFADVVGNMADGSIIERGANANGQYVRFADGTQICARTAPGGYEGGQGILSLYAAVFEGSPVLITTVGAAASTSAGGAFSLEANLISAQGFRLKAMVQTPGQFLTGSTVYCGVLAFGRWK